MKTKKFLVALLALGTFCSVNAQQWTPGTGTLFVNPTTTKVGIGLDGTTTPETGLQIKSSDYMGSSLTLERTSGIGGPCLFFKAITPTGSLTNGIALGALSFKGSTGLNTVNQSTIIASLATETWNIGATGSRLTFATTANGTNSPKVNLSIENDGKVKIGSSTLTTPGEYKLYVETGILTEKIKVAVKTTTDWSDFVFAKDYKLRPLSSVESFINENKHLPDVPSASTVVNAGIDLAKMDATLLQKVEELTLYMIQLQKQNEELAKQIVLLKK